METICDGRQTLREEECNSSTSSSSIGDDSDLDRDDDDVDSSNNNGSFDDAIEALEQALPIRRGISKYYNGKSKSFTGLVDSTSSSSIQDIAKPENAYTRRRRNLVATAFKKLSTKKISKKHKTTPTQTSFSMLNLHRYKAAKIGNY